MSIIKRLQSYFGNDANIELSTVYEHPNFRCEFPCIAAIDPNTLISVFRIADDHFATLSDLVYVISKDRGETWSQPEKFTAERSMQLNNSSWNCPSITRLENGEFILACDENIKDSSDVCTEKLFKVKCHFWRLKFDNTLVVKEHWDVEYFDVFGFNPDRILPLPDGRWLLGWHFWGNRILIDGKPVSDNPNAIQWCSFSDDEGKSWYGHTLIADKPDAHICDGNIIIVDKDKLGCFMRDHSGNGAPSYVSFSEDMGKSWSELVALPFSGHHNITKRMVDEVFFSFYRNVRLVNGEVKKEDIGVWGTLFNINDLRRHKSFEIEYDGTEWKNCGWGDTLITDDGKIICHYYLTGERKNPVIRQAKIEITPRVLAKLRGRK